MSGAWEGGSTREWRTIRGQVLRRDRYRCQLRIEGKCQGRADCVHHTRGKAQGDDPRGLVAACTPCNLAIGDPNRPPGSSGRRRGPVADPDPVVRTRW